MSEPEPWQTNAGAPFLTIEKPGGAVSVWSLGKERFRVEAPGRDSEVKGYQEARALAQRARCGVGVGPHHLSLRAGTCEGLAVPGDAAGQEHRAIPPARPPCYGRASDFCKGTTLRGVRMDNYPCRYLAKRRSPILRRFREEA
jgi:hypothetical protein